MSAPSAMNVLAVRYLHTLERNFRSLGFDVTAAGIREQANAVAELVEACRELSADLEHAIGLANLERAGTVSDGHPIRVALNRVDAALERVGRAA